VVGAYVHGNKRIAVLVELKGGDQDLARDVAMHVAAVNPQVVRPEDMPEEVVAKEKEIYTAQALESGKPAEIVEKMIGGRIKKFLAENSLVEQAFVKDPDTTVGKLVAAAAPAWRPLSASRWARASRSSRSTSPPRSPRSSRAEQARRHGNGAQAPFFMPDSTRRETRAFLVDCARTGGGAMTSGKVEKKYKRILLKLSGEALTGASASASIPRCSTRWRWRSASWSASACRWAGGRRRQPVPRRGPAGGGPGPGHRRPHGHAGHGDECPGPARCPGALNIATQVMSSIPMSGVVDHYDRRKAIRALSNGDVVIFCAPAPATRSSPPIPRPACAASRSRPTSCSRPPRSTASIRRPDEGSRDAVKYDAPDLRRGARPQARGDGPDGHLPVPGSRMPVRVFEMESRALLNIVRGGDDGTLIE
jgi:hypothetical protein